MKIRVEENLELLKIVKNFLSLHPELRFIQALWALGIVDDTDRFHEEPEETIKRVKEKLK